MKTAVSKILPLCLAVGTIAAFADESVSQVSRYKEGETGASADAADFGRRNSPVVSFSVRAGLHDWKDSRFVDKSWGAQGEMRFAFPETPLDIVLRGHYATVDYEDTHSTYANAYPYRGTRVGEIDVVQYYNAEQSAFGGSLQLQWNFAREDLVNPYVAAGGMYEKSEFHSDYLRTRNGLMTYKWLATSWSDSYRGRIDEDDDGWAFVGRLGTEIAPSPFYLRLEMSWVSELYDDDAQAEFGAIAGVDATENARFDVAGTYFSDWKEYYISAGLTLSF